MTWGIVTDSSSDLRASDLKDKSIGLEVVPLSIVVDQCEITDDDNVDLNQLLQLLKHSKTGSSSACPSPEAFRQAFIKYDNIIAVTMTGALSGTYSSACTAKDMVLEEFPDKNIFIIDSRSTAGALAMTVKYTAEIIKENISFSEVCDKAKAFCDNLHLVFTLSCYDNLVKAGRMNSFTGIVASCLGIRAVSVATEKGEIVVAKKARGELRAYEAMMDIMAENNGAKEHGVSICHCKNYEGAVKCKQLIKSRFGITNITILDCKALTSFYAMPGGIILAY